ncbi:MAG: cyclic nucleotide-binding domain-containing protein [Synergistaceae bacterium]|nr:cyclic nucleotide-binding domain-containing protein [Synergistaceae bacterium]
MFIGREKELTQLEEAYNGEGCKFFVIQGGKGIGKTTLIEEFCRNKNALIFSPVSMGAKANLKHFSWLILRHYSDTMQREFQFWEDALNYIAGKNERIIIAVDNADILAATSPLIMKVFAKVLASSFEGKNILLIFSCKDSSMLKVTGLFDRAFIIQLEKFLNEKNIESLKREEMKNTVIGHAKFLQVPADTVIIREGEMNAEMYKIISGRAICNINYGTDDEYLLGSLNEGKTFGEYSLLTDNPGIYTVTAYSDMLLLRISRSDFESFIQMNAANSVNIMRNMAVMMNTMKVNINMLNEELKA